MVKKAQVKKNNKKADKLCKTKEQLAEIKKKQQETKRLHNIETQKRAKEQEANDKIYADLLCEYIKQQFPYMFGKTHGNRKFSIELIVKEVLYFLKAGLSYKMTRSLLKKTTLHYYVNFFTKNNIFINFYWFLHQKYATKNLADNLKYQSTDTSFIVNQYGLEEFVKRNPLMKGKNCIKISLLVDANGIPLDIQFCAGNCNDSPMLRKHLTEMKFNTNTKKYINNHRYKQYFLADAGYDSKESMEMLKEKGYIGIIPKNRRRSKTEIPPMSDKEKIIYKKRNIVENVFANYKQFRRVSKVYERKLDNYISLAHLALSALLFNLLKRQKIYDTILKV